MNDCYDVAIVGGGPAGLSAALMLGRSCRRVLVLDSDKPRNHAARAVHGFIGSEGITPAALRASARSQCERYGVRFIRTEVVNGVCEGDTSRTTFSLTTQTGAVIQARKVLLATGVADKLPQIPGFLDLYGVTAHHCPYCDGWEHKHKHLVAYGKSKSAMSLAITRLTWSNQVTCCTDGSELPSSSIDRLCKYGVSYRSETITELVGAEKVLEEIHFRDGTSLKADAFFFSAEQGQRSNLPKLLGCKCDEDGLVVRQGKQGSGVRGLFLAGDADGDVQFVIAAAAEGAIAATAINSELTEEDYP